MNRRFVLATLTMPFASGVAGCFEQVASTGSDPLSVPDPVLELEFEIVDAGRAPEADPSISFDEETGEATIDGTLWVGSRKCKEATITDVSLDESEGMIRFVVTDGKSDDHPDNRPLGGSCDDAMSADGYRIATEVTDDVPAISVVERDAEETERSASTT